MSLSANCYHGLFSVQVEILCLILLRELLWYTGTLKINTLKGNNAAQSLKRAESTSEGIERWQHQVSVLGKGVCVRGGGGESACPQKLREGRDLVYGTRFFPLVSHIPSRFYPPTVKWLSPFWSWKHWGQSQGGGKLMHTCWKTGKP